MSGLINLGEHRSRSQREIDALRWELEGYAAQNQKAFYLLSVLVARHGPVISITLKELEALNDSVLCGFAVSRETGEVTLYTHEMGPIIMAALRAEVMRKNDEANAVPERPTVVKEPAPEEER